jgi:hypothetical protein
MNVEKYIQESNLNFLRSDNLDKQVIIEMRRLRDSYEAYDKKNNPTNYEQISLDEMNVNVEDIDEDSDDDE